MDKRSWVRGQWIPYDTDAINQFLGHPLVLEEGQRCKYAERRSKFSGFDEEAICQLLFSTRHDFARSVAGRWVRIMCTSMTTLTQIWMTLLLSNIFPSDHNSDILLPKCQLVYSIMAQISVHVAQLISDVIHQFVGIASLRHLVDPENSNKALGFLALIASLCQFYVVSVALTKLIQPPINMSFIEKYCMPRQAQQSAADAPAPPPHQPPSLESILAHMQRMELQMHAYMQHLAYQQAANHRGQMQLNDSFYQYTLHQHREDPNPYPWPTLE